MKKCSICQRYLDLVNFCKNKRSKDGYNYQCKTCVSNITKSETFKKKRRERYKLLPKKQRYQTDCQREHKSLYDKKYRLLNKDKIKQHKKDWEQKNKNNPIFKIKRNLRRRVHHALKGARKQDKTFNLIGCTPIFFRKHIESLWETGMNWDNYGVYWHIDHIIPCYKFDLTKPENQIKCFHYTNQRPLWAKDNLSRKRT